MAPVRLPGTRPRALEMEAVTGARPTASSTGKVTSVPEPTTALMDPAASPASATATISHAVMAALRRGCHTVLWQPPAGRGGSGAGELAARGAPPVLGQPVAEIAERCRRQVAEPLEGGDPRVDEEPLLL